MEFRRMSTALAAVIEAVVMVVLSASIRDRRWRNPVMAALLLGVPVAGRGPALPAPSVVVLPNANVARPLSRSRRTHPPPCA